MRMPDWKYWKLGRLRAPRIVFGLRIKAALFSAMFILGTVLTGVVGSFTLYQQNISLQQALEESQKRADQAADSRAYLIDMTRAQAQLIAEVDAKRIREASRNAIRALSLMDENVQNLQQILTGNSKIGRLQTLLSEARPALLRVIGMARKNDDAAALDENRRMISVLTEIEELSNEIVKDERQRLLETFQAQIQEGVKRVQIIALGVAVFALTAILVSQFAARTIVTPIRTAANAAERVAAGDLTVEIASKRKDELGKLLGSISAMVSRLSGLVGKVKGSGDQLSSTAGRVMLAAEQQAQVSGSFGAASSEIASSVTQIAGASAALLETMSQVSTSMDKTAAVADRGQTGLVEMEETMQALARAAQSISSKLAEMAERAANIGVVVTTIAKVADQTNLLSLNAAIEAEKAGEFGRGFGVVAREIRRLADQTAVATLDIEHIIGEMSQAVSSSVGEMESFDEQVRSGVDKTTQVGDELSTIIRGVEELKPRFASVHEGMQAQVAGADRIRTAVGALRAITDQSNVSSETLKSIASQLDEAVDSLNSGINQFNVGDNPDVLTVG